MTHHPSQDSPVIDTAIAPMPNLTARCLAGDECAMRELVERFRRPVFGLCLRMLGQREDAEDAAQETFRRALRYLASWDPATEFSPWLLAIAGNRCRTALGKRVRRGREEPLLEAADVSAPPSAANELREELDLALAELRDEYRQALLMFHQDQMSYEEIAAALGCPLGTVKTWVHRARQEMLQHLRGREQKCGTTMVR
jgi:RNA polymerase sigma-70 factor (ECF subfamily)